MAIVVYIAIFASYCSAILLYFFPGLLTYKEFSILYAVVVLLILLRQIWIRKAKISRKVFCLIAVYLAILFDYAFITPTFYTTPGPGSYDGQLLSMAGQVFPGMLLASLFVDNHGLQKRFKALAPAIGVMFVFIAFVCAINPTTNTSAGFVISENGLNYQSISYLASYGAALVEYYLITEQTYSQISFFHKPLGKLIAYTSVFVSFVTILIAGGRGGIVTFCVFALLSLILAAPRMKRTKKNFVLQIMLPFIICIALFAGITYAANSNLTTSGFKRIIGFFTGEGDKKRDLLRSRAIKVFCESPIIGHGFGSVFWELGHYSHNFFTDALVEVGLLGCGALFCIIIKVLANGISMIRQDFSDWIWGYIFLCGFMMSMFSGYYLTHLHLWIPLSFIIQKKTSKQSRLL